MKTFYQQGRRLLLLGLLSAASVQVQAQCNMTPSVTATQLSTCDSISINWPAVSGAISYIYATNTTGVTPSAGSLASTNSAVKGGLTPGTLTYVFVKTNCNGGVSGWQMTTITTCGTPPGGGGGCTAPSTMPAPPVATANSVSFSWNGVTGATGYEYVIDNSYNNPTGSGTPATGTSANVSGLTSGTIYQIHLRTQCGTGTYSGWSTPVTFVTTGSNPSCTAPARPTIVVPRCDTVSISWAAVSGVSGYQFMLDQSPADPPSNINTSATVYRKKNLTASTLYYFHLRSVCNNTSYSAWVTDSFRTPSCGGGTTCNAPATVTIGSLLPRSATASWTAATGAAGYEYVLSRSATSPTGAGTAITGTSVNLASLTPNTDYYFHIRTNCSGTYSAWKAGTLLRTPNNTGVGTLPGAAVLGIHPNPATDRITVELSQAPSGDARMGIYNISGQRVLQLAPALQTTGDISRLPAGIYILRYSDGGQHAVLRFTKQ